MPYQKTYGRYDQNEKRHRWNDGGKPEVRPESVLTDAPAAAPVQKAAEEPHHVPRTEMAGQARNKGGKPAMKGGKPAMKAREPREGTSRKVYMGATFSAMNDLIVLLIMQMPIFAYFALRSRRLSVRYNSKGYLAVMILLALDALLLGPAVVGLFGEGSERVLTGIVYFLPCVLMIPKVMTYRRDLSNYHVNAKRLYRYLQQQPADLTQVKLGTFCRTAFAGIGTDTKDMPTLFRQEVYPILEDLKQLKVLRYQMQGEQVQVDLLLHLQMPDS